MYEILRNRGHMQTNVVWDDSTNSPTANPTRIHRSFYDMAHSIYNMNDNHKPDFSKFHEICRDFFPTSAPPQGPPDAETLHNQAQRARPASSADGDRAYLPLALPMS